MVLHIFKLSFIPKVEHSEHGICLFGMRIKRYAKPFIEKSKKKAFIKLQHF